MMSHRVVLACAVLLLAVVAVAACGDDDDEGTGTPDALPSIGSIQDQPEPVQELDAEAVEAEGGIIEITAAGTRFGPNNVSTTVGEAVTVRVINDDPQPHSLRIAGPDGVYETEDDAVTAPDSIEGGSTGELIFSPVIPGAYTFRCDFHPGSMGGRIVVGGD